MRPEQLWIALVALFGFAVVLPITYWYIGEYATGLPTETAFLAGLVPVALVLLYATSWIGAGGA